MAHVFALTNAKGGCGKTTVALNLAICFAKEGFRTLAIDLDQQGNLSAGLVLLFINTVTYYFSSLVA